MRAVVTDNYHWVITAESTMFQSFQAVSKELGIRKEDRTDEIKYSPPVPYFHNVSSEIFDQVRFKPACSTTEAS